MWGERDASEKLLPCALNSRTLLPLEGAFFSLLFVVALNPAGVDKRLYSGLRREISVSTFFFLLMQHCEYFAKREEARKF